MPECGNNLKKVIKKMKAVIQRVSEAEVSVGGETVGRCGEGLFILVCAEKGDSEGDSLLLAEKISKLRIFADENGKMNRSLNDIGGGALVVSNFTLCANYKHGNRPDFFAAAEPETANKLYEDFISLLRLRVKSGAVEHGVFGADMKIKTVCDGPVTIVMESSVLRRDGKAL